MEWVEEIKEKMKSENPKHQCLNFANYSEVMNLISEIEQLRKVLSVEQISYTGKQVELERVRDLLERALPRLNGVSDIFRNEIKQALKEG